MVRGSDSTGLAVAGGKKKNKTNFSTLKDVCASHELLYSGETKNYLEDARPRTILGHCRYATSGHVNLRNAHPIQEKHITGCHNGTIWNFQPKKEDEEHTTDSRILFRKMAEVGVVDTLKQVGMTGAYALTWFNAQNMTLNIIRNRERSLWLMENAPGNTVYWASEEIFLDFLASRHKPGAFRKPFEIPTGVLHQWKLGQINLVTEKLDVDPVREKQGPLTWCKGCNHIVEYCRCHAEDAEILDVKALFHDMPVEAPKLLDMRPYKAYNGVIQGVHNILAHLRCYWCDKVNSPVDRVFWTGPEDCLCADCYHGADPFLKHSLSKETVWEGRLQCH